MQFHMLLDSRLHPVPDGVNVHNFGTLSIMPKDDHPKDMPTTGDHVIVDGDPEVIRDWLRPFDGVWVGEGQPMEQKFAIKHIP